MEIVSRLSPSITNKQRKLLTTATENSLFLLLLESKLTNLKFKSKSVTLNELTYFVSNDLNSFGVILSFPSSLVSSYIAIPEILDELLYN